MQVQSTQEGSGPRTSEPMIPSVRDEFYNYTAEFSTDRPLGYLMKCKANKARSLRFAQDHPDDLDLVFLFGNGVRICSPNSPLSVGLLDDLDIDMSALPETKIAIAGIRDITFEEARQSKDGKFVAGICRRARKHTDNVVLQSVGCIVAVSTQSSKYGLLRVTELTPTAIKVEACHILL